MVDTDDLVQVTLVRALERLREFEPRREQGFLAYLRRILLNQIRDELRRAKRRPGRDPLHDSVADDRPSPLDQVIGKEMLERYERALSELSSAQREALVLRVELGLSYLEMAETLGRSSPNAARLLVTRARMHLAKAMRGDRKLK
jgi:RNA polymerase sigma-70 factor, ECF subfamily